MESFGHKMFISSQPVPLMGTGVLYPRVRDFLFHIWVLEALKHILYDTANFSTIIFGLLDGLLRLGTLFPQQFCSDNLAYYDI